MIDEIDRVILSDLSKNARIPVAEITDHLRQMEHKITERAIRYRLKRLESSNTILGYSPIFNPSIISDKISRTILLKFRITRNISDLVEKLTKYIDNSDFCLFSARMSGDFDFICHFVFDSIEQYELESDNFINRFTELVSEYRTYDCKIIKATPYSILDEQESNEKKFRIYKIINSLRKSENLNTKLQLTVDSLVKYFDASFARMWLLDKDNTNLILKFSSGKYRNSNGEFSKVSTKLTSKIGTIVKRNKPVITNDVVNDPRIKYPLWAEKEKLRSFAGYPITHAGKPIGVLAMFSRKTLSPIEFELLGIFADHISKELSTFYEAKELLNMA
ncbi:MAG TPA: GAF domain-containing protein [Candidatus Nitrosocosmicus sp.]|nr:GAF domain-containing protein [Candidatus Nitrosocosmicus sp.]